MRNLKLYITLVVFFLFQTCIARFLGIAGCIPNTLIVLVVCFSAMNTLSVSSLVFVAICGFVNDFACGTVWGMSSLLFLGFSVAAMLVSGKFYRAKVPLAMGLTLLLSFVFEVIGYALLLRGGSSMPVSDALIGVVLPSAVYNCLLSPIVYWILKKILAEKHYFEQIEE